MMPVMDGYATMRAMREAPSGEQIPLVAFTAKVEDGERQRCIDAGASAYVPKPVDTGSLLQVLGEWLPAAAVTPSAGGLPAQREESSPELVGPALNGEAAAVAAASEAPELKPPSSPTGPAGTDLTGRKIMMVDDDFRNIFALTALLKKAD